MTMVTHWILLAFFSLCRLSFGQDKSPYSECNPTLQENIDFAGTDIMFMYSPDVEHCQQLCTQHPSCLFFTFIRPDWTQDNRHFYCYLKSTPSGEPTVQTVLLGVTSGFSLKNCNLNPKPCLSQVYENVDFFGADYRMFFTDSYEECQRACTQDPGCQFFTFVNDLFRPESIRFKCHLKFSWNIPSPTIVERKSGLISGFSHNIDISQHFDTVCNPRLFPSTDIPGSNIQSLPAASPEQCHSLCSAHPSCTYFSYSINDLSCQLKSNPNQMVVSAKGEVTSGIPSRFCQFDDNWLRVAQEGIHFRGSDMRNVLTDGLETCQTTCTEDPNCQFYTYVNETYSISEIWRRCYLKRVITMPAPPKVTKLSHVVSGFSLRNCA
ncbi:coagulation factor XI-like [Parambassis ranga]|uniref:Coagulation factor XI-like n=1 Tax=Parambassis ranga TaxID=210632 RepID=A0A6P7H2F1_9TELE|nr:coagulation factor XI-like [Parambassis ranga]